jgi:hypothetical protein
MTNRSNEDGTTIDFLAANDEGSHESPLYNGRSEVTEESYRATLVLFIANERKNVAEFQKQDINENNNILPDAKKLNEDHL